MNKVITVNLNGNAYQVEESGYNALRAYLDHAQLQLKDNPDRAEIIADFEQAIAEKCRNFLGPQKSVVTAAEIAAIIREMGPVDDEAGSTSGTQSQQAQDAGSSAHSGSRGPKRFFRIREGKIIQGVCTGLAAYFGIDVKIVRLICIAPALLFPAIGASEGLWFGLIGYFLIVWSVPEAETSEEHAAAHGMQFNAQDFINQAKEHYSEFKQNEDEEWKRRAKETKHEWQRSWRRTMRNSHRWRRPAAPPPPGPLAGIALPIFGIVTAALSILWVMAVISLVKTHAIFGWPVPLEFPTWAAILILLVLLEAVTAPLKYMRHASRYGYGNPVGGLASVMASTLWIAGLALAGWWVYTHSPEVQAFVQHLPNAWSDLLNR